VGPLLQRDYWGVISNCRLKPSELIDWVARRFPEFAPTDRAIFSLSQHERPLEVGDELRVRIRAAGVAYVRVLSKTPQSFTLGTLEGHPEAGRITFGAYRNAIGDVIFQIRSRAYSSARLVLLGFLAIGDPMQIHTWTDFIQAVSVSAGDGIVGFIHAETSRLPDAFESEQDLLGPTFIARGD
jgi:hypothetical protein